MSELNKAIMIHSSTDGLKYNALTNISVCNNCGKRTLICPHKNAKETIVELPSDTTHLKCLPVEPDMRITLSSERNTRMSQVVESAKFSLLEVVTQLEDIWQEIGIKEDQKEVRSDTVLQHIQDLLKEMLADEEDLRSKMKLNINEYELELSQLLQDLGLPARTTSKSLTLLQTESKLRNDVDTLNKEKHDRLKSLKRLRSDEQELCDRLVMPQHELNFEGCPTLEQLRELEQNVKFLKSEKSKRLELFQKLQHSIMQLWTDLEAEPSTNIEQALCAEAAVDQFTLSVGNLDTITALQEKLQNQQTELVQQIEGLKKQVESLWERLETPSQERKSFLDSTSNRTPKVAKMFKKEVERLTELKRQHMQKFIESIRKELVSLWDQCYFGEEQRQLFASFYSDIFTEEILSEHEHQVATVKNFYEENKEMFKLVDKREALWTKKLEFESRSTDSNRLNNRGGALLKEEKIRKAVEKELPKIEGDIKKKIKKWEEENETYFMIKGMRYADYLEHQKQDYDHEVRLKKEEKVRMKQVELSQEVHYGSKSKRKCNVGTPIKSAKMPRMNATHTPTRFVHSSILPSPRLARSAAENKKTVTKTSASLKALKKNNKVKTEARRKSLKRRSIRMANAKRVLKEQNGTSNLENTMNMLNQQSSTSSINDDVKVVSGSQSNHPSNMSLISYNDFTNAVAESPYSRSSFLCRPGDDRVPSLANFSSLNNTTTSVSSSSRTRSTRSSNRTIDRAPKML